MFFWRARAMPSAPGGHVVGDHRACARVRAVAETDRRDEHRVDADERAGADRGAVLVLAVVVGGDRSGADVGPLADVGVADVGQVRDLRAGADVRVLDLDERAGLRSLAQHGARPQVRERPDADPVADVGPVEIGVDDRSPGRRLACRSASTADRPGRPRRSRWRRGGSRTARSRCPGRSARRRRSRSWPGRRS